MSDIVTRARELLAGITPGPWEHRFSTPEDTGESHAEYQAGTLIGDGEPLHVLIAPSADPKFAYIVPAITGDGPTSSDNAEFIAAAPQLVADLTDGVEKLRQDYLKAIQDLEFHAGLLHNAENVAEWMREAARQHRVRLEAAHG